MESGDCVEVADLSDAEIGVRDSKGAPGAVLKFTPEEWDAFIGGVRNSEFDRRHLTSIYAATADFTLLL